MHGVGVGESCLLLARRASIHLVGAYYAAVFTAIEAVDTVVKVNL